MNSIHSLGSPLFEFRVLENPASKYKVILAGFCYANPVVLRFVACSVIERHCYFYRSSFEVKACIQFSSVRDGIPVARGGTPGIRNTDGSVPMHRPDRSDHLLARHAQI
jgi:hypothetical protein